MDVLDHGYVKLIETWGADERIIEAARMSTDKGFKGWGTTEKAGDEKLLRFLYENHHTTPFEMAGATFEVMAPIFVFREWHRHRTQSYNEMSARYIPLPDVNYVPSVERLLAQATANKQAQSTGRQLTEPEAKVVQGQIRHAYVTAQYVYEEALRYGTPKELARLVLPVGRYSRMRASSNLLNWIRFLRLRCAKNAQWEIQEYANAVLAHLAQVFPRTMQLFNEESNGN